MLLHPTRKHIQYGDLDILNGLFKSSKFKPDESIKRHFYSSDSNRTIGFSNIQSIFLEKYNSML